MQPSQALTQEQPYAPLSRPAPLPRHGTMDAASRLPAATTTGSRVMKRHAPSGTPARHQRGATLAALAIATAMLTTFAVALLTSKGHANGFASRLLLRRQDGPLDAHRRLTVFGADDRRVVSDASLYPYSAVGLLKWSADRNCTASLVGSKYALTAADCVLSRDGTWRASSLAQPELLVGGGAAATSAHVVKVHRQSEYWTEWTQDTYVLLELDAPLGDTLGKLLLPTAEDLNQSQGKTPVQLVGYDDDVTRTTAASPKPALKFAKCTCYFPGTFSGPQYMLHHDCDTSAIGSPGSVLLVRYTSMETYIIGIHTNLIGEDAPEVEADAALAGYSDAVANRGVLGPFVQQHLKALMASSTQESAKAGSSSGSSAGSPPVGSTPSSATPRPWTPSDSGHNEGAVGDAADPDARISAETAYVCISFVGAAWACILFIVLRHIRNRK